MVDVARRAGFAVGTVLNTLNNPAVVAGVRGSEPSPRSSNLAS